MKLGDTGEAFFVQEVDFEDDFVDENLATSPLPGSPIMSSEGSPGASKKGDTDDSDDGTPEVELRGGNDVAITIVEDENVNEGLTTSKEARPDDVKSRRRRKKRKKNQVQHSVQIFQSEVSKHFLRKVT